MSEPRNRPERFINCLRLTLERGDGECIDLGEPPNIDDFASVLNFLVRLNNAVCRCGYYDFRDSMEWSPQQLEFDLFDKPK